MAEGAVGVVVVGVPDVGAAVGVLVPADVQVWVDLRSLSILVEHVEVKLSEVQLPQVSVVQLSP